MSTVGDWSYWLMALAVLAVNTALVYVAWWALFSDRSKGRRRCPRCWYDMAYSTGMTCPECGHTPKNEQQFFRTRRRFGFAAGAIFASVSICLFITDRISERGFTSVAPSRVLLWLLPMVDEKSGIYSELTDRARFGQLSVGNWKGLVQRATNGDPWSQPTSDAWMRKYGDFLWSVRMSFADYPELEQLLLPIPPRIELTTNEVWPQGLPVTLNVQVRDWWPWGTECRVRAQPRVAGKAIGEPVIFYRTADHRFHRTPYALHLPPLDEIDPELSSIEVEFQIDRRRLPLTSGGQIRWDDDEVLDADWEPVTRTTVAVATRAEGELQHIAQPVHDEALDDTMKRAFADGVVRWARGRSPVRFNVATPVTFGPEFNDTLVGVRAELLCDGAVVRRLNMWWRAGTGPNLNLQLRSRGYGFEVDYEDLDMLRQPMEDGRWQMRVRSDPQIALRAGAAPKYWEGEFTIPLRVHTRSDAAPPRPWRERP